MNNLVNKVQLIGNLGNAPEITTLENGNKMAKFSVATNESYTNKKGEKVENTQWHNLTMFGKGAELADQLLRKGSKVMIEGKLVNRTWDDKDGNKRYATDVQVNNFLVLSPKEETAVVPF